MSNGSRSAQGWNASDLFVTEGKRPAVRVNGDVVQPELPVIHEAEMLLFLNRILNERQRTAVLLCKFEGMSYDEIGETLELSTSAVKSLLSRARGNLRDILHPYLNDGRIVGTSGDSALKPGEQV